MTISIEKDMTETKCVGDMKIGDTFMLGGIYYIKAEYQDDEEMVLLYIDLLTGGLTTLGNKTPIVPINIKMTLTSL